MDDYWFDLKKAASAIAMKLVSTATGEWPNLLLHWCISFALNPKIEHEIDCLVKSGVLVPVKFSSWATPVLPVLKSDGSVACVETFKVTINPHLVEQKYPLPTIEY